MDIIIAIIAIFGAAGAIIFESFIGMNGGIKAALVALMVLIAVYALARIPPKQTTSEKDNGK